MATVRKNFSEIRRLPKRLCNETWRHVIILSQNYTTHIYMYTVIIHQQYSVHVLKFFLFFFSPSLSPFLLVLFYTRPRRNHNLPSAWFRFLVNWIRPVNYYCGSTSEVEPTISDLRYAATTCSLRLSSSGDRSYIGVKLHSPWENGKGRDYLPFQLTSVLQKNSGQ